MGKHTLKPDSPRLMSREEAMRYLGGISLSTLERMINAGTLPTVKFSVVGTRPGSRRVFLDIRDLDRLIDEAKINNT